MSIEIISDRDVFNKLSKVDVSTFIEKKANLSYLSWANAWRELLKLYPESRYMIYENAEGLNYHHDNKTAWVKTGVIVEGIEHIEYLPVMDFRNKSIPIENITSMDVNKAIQRSLTKAVARHGLGLYIYAGEDLPEETKQQDSEEERQMLIAEFKELAKSSNNNKAKETAETIEDFKTEQIRIFIHKLKTQK